MKFKAAILTEINKPLEIHEIEATPLQVGQVLVEVIVSGICGSQLQEISGAKGNAKYLPHLMGHEGVGLVVDVGPGVTHVAKGDLVVMHWRKGAGIESTFPKYIFKGKEITSGLINTFTEFATVSENRLTKVQEDSDIDFCALLGCGLSTGLAIANKEANIKFGESVLVVGCGGLGLNIIQGALLCQADVVGVDNNENKRKYVEGLGARFHPFGDLLEEKFDVVIEGTGIAEVISKYYQNLKPSGRYILAGQSKIGKEITLPNDNSLFNGEGITIKATQGGSFNPTQDIPNYLKLEKTIDLKKLISHDYRFERINTAIQTLRDGEASRILIHF